MTPPASEQSAVQAVHDAQAESAIRMVHEPQSGIETRISQALSQASKRTFDIVLAAMMLLATVPLMLLIAVAIKLDSRGPVFFRVRRVGYRGQALWMLKFRKMYANAAGGPLTVDGDSRLTRVGAFLTRTKLDELPQLWDVLRGRMSIVGPRPEDPRFVAMHPTYYERIVSVRPGMTGIAQLAFAEERQIIDEHDPVRDYVMRILPAKVSLDMLYAERHRIGLDISILCWTVVALFLRRPIAVNRSTCRMRIRKRPIGGEAVSAGEAGAAEPVPASEAVWS